MDPSPHFIFPFIAKGKDIYLKSKRNFYQKTIEYTKNLPKGIIIKFSDLYNINSALKYIGYDLFSPENLKKNNKENNFQDYLHFLIKEKSGKEWGRVTGYSDVGGNQLLEIKNPDGHEIYVPFTQSIIKEILLEEKIIIIDPPMGLEDLNT